MAKIYNNEVGKRLAKNAGIQQNVDKVPNELAEKIVPTMESNPELLRKTKIVRSSIAANSTGGTIYTTLANQDFYMTYAQLNVIKDVTSTSTGTNINVIIEDGTTQKILDIRGITLTPQDNATSISFVPPLKVARGSAITLTNNSAVANISSVGIIGGYYDEQSNA